MIRTGITAAAYDQIKSSAGLTSIDPARRRLGRLPDPLGGLIMKRMAGTLKKRANPHTTPQAQGNWSNDWEVAVRVWIERRGKTVLGEGLADLLAAIQRTSSISAAARLLGISYRHPWKLVQEGNAAAGEPLVTAAVGGHNGGGAQLTPRGELS